MAEVQEGANILISLSSPGANLNFIYEIKTVNLELNPSVVSNMGELQREEIWRNPAMAAIGYSAGASGLYDYLQFLRTSKWQSVSRPDWAYIAFFTKYAAYHFAYATRGGPRLVMQYSNNGYGPDEIDRIFAHETGHIFGAPDEYSESNCIKDNTYGYLNVKNGNCEINNPNSIPCLMNRNTPQICQWTLAHFGWCDTDNDGIPDVIDNT